MLDWSLIPNNQQQVYKSINKTKMLKNNKKNNKNQKRVQPRRRRRESTTRGVMKYKIKKPVKCVKCKQATFYPVKCARCDEWHKRNPTTMFFMPFYKTRPQKTSSGTDPLCVDCIFQDEYYGDVCGDCQKYLSSPICNASFETGRIIYPCRCCTIPIGKGECEHRMVYWEPGTWP